MKIVVNRAACSGHARCFSVAPKLFQLDDDGYIAVDTFVVAPGDEALAQRGAHACPELALTVEEEGTADAAPKER